MAGTEGYTLLDDQDHAMNTTYSGSIINIPDNPDQAEAMSPVNVTDANLHLFLYSTVDTLLVTAVMPLIFTIGVLGNLAVIAVFVRVRSMRTVTNHYLVSLAVADLTFILLSVPQFWVMYATSPLFGDYRVLQSGYCKLTIYLTESSIIASCFTVILVTFERYVAICWPHKFKELSTKPRAVLLCTLVWVFALGYKIPTLCFSTVVEKEIVWMISAKTVTYPDSIYTCYFCYPEESNMCNAFKKSLTLDQIMLLMVIPITMVMYSLIVLQLQKLAKSTMIRGTGSSSSTRMKKQVVRMLIVTITLFVICMTPFRILNLFNIYNFKLPPNSQWVLVNVGRIMLYTNCSVNPIIYNIMSDRYRQAFHDTFLCCLPKRGEANHEQSSCNRKTTKYTASMWAETK
ncbi:QRFP-like peptide receptor [Patiria miniata]|uniref:G-protein coupled receptors family 1 profile domain-containing protein n=1 Tax=Patiria miniata TaxID=46514 RepID=A0A914BS07_PATMI|nr:QRFP-like peptide receptor [Patiria miniata]